LIGNGRAPVTRARVLRWAILALTVVGGAWAVAFAVVAASDQFVYDAHAYWVADPATAYMLPEGSPDALLYTPPAILLFSLFGHIPWPTFATVWSVLIAAAITFMAGPFTLPAVLTNPIASEITLGNIHAFTGIVVIAGFRKPAVWAFVLLTKVTPGVGLLWFVFRKEWRNLGIALGATLLIALPTMVLAPDLWGRWIGAMLDARGSRELASGIFAVPFGIRMAVAVAILWWGARSDRAWVVPIAVTLGLPVLWDHGLATALAAIWLAMHPDFVGVRRRTTAQAEAAPAGPGVPASGSIPPAA
jgi:hypothetical protein